MSVLIKGGRIVTAVDDYVADVLIEGETIAAVGSSLNNSADRVIDATGKYVIPGAIDPHTHMEMPFGGTVSCDDFTSGTVSAAFGGTTSLIDFCLQAPGQSIPEALATWHEKIERCPPMIDVGFHMAITDLHDGGRLEDVARVPDEGVTSYKLFMAYKGAIMVDDETLFRTMQVAARTGALVMVHAENGDTIDVLVKQALAEGKTDPRWHAATRPPETEAEATNRAVMLAHIAGCPLYVVHVSCRESVEPIAAARSRGWRTWGETCTQYLFIDETRLEEPDFAGAKFVYTPPPRAASNHEHLWTALRTGVLSVVSTDHCPFRWSDQKTLGRDDFSKIPNGGPGVENRLHMLHHFGVRQGRLTMNQLVDLPGGRRRHRRVGQREAAHPVRRDPPQQRRLQPLRGDRGDRGAGDGARARPGDRRSRRAGGPSGRRAVRAPGPVRRAAGDPAAGRGLTGEGDRPWLLTPRG
jgi:dihydropyrimidinase